MGKPFRQRADLDGCEWSCPCGSTTYTNDGWSHQSDIRNLKAWLREHAKHTDGTIEYGVSADGLRCLASDPGVYTKPLSECFPGLVEEA